MDKLDQAIEKGRKGYFAVEFKKLADYLDTGDPTAVKAMKSHDRWWLTELVGKLPAPTAWGQRERRLVEFITLTGEGGSVFTNIAEHLKTEPPDADYTRIVVDIQKPIRKQADIDYSVARNAQPLLRKDGTPTSAGRYVLTLESKLINSVFTQASRWQMDDVGLLRLLAAHAPDKLKHVARAAVASSGHPDVQCARVLLEADEAFVQVILDVLDHTPDHGRSSALMLARVLYDRDPVAYRDLLLKHARTNFSHEFGTNAKAAVETLIELLGDDAIDEARQFFEQPENVREIGVMNAVANHFGRKALPVILQGLDMFAAGSLPGLEQGYRGRTWAHIKFLGHLVDHAADTHRDRIIAELEAGLADPGYYLQDYLRTLGKFDPLTIRDTLTTLLSHKSKPARRSAARLLGRTQDPDVIADAIKMLTAKKAATREAAALVLAVAGTDDALAALHKQLDRETKDDVRDVMLTGLAEAWSAAGRSFTKADMQKRVRKAKAAGRLDKPAFDWLDADKLPPMQWTDGKKLSADEVRFILYRQARAKEVRADVEVEPMFALLDRKSTAPAAKVILDGFLAGPRAAGDRGALTLAGLLGDDGVVPPLAKAVRSLVDDGRGKVAEYAVQALALLGTDAALLAVDAVAIRYRNKMKNVGKAAVEAFAAAAEAKGLTVDELGDRVVPYLGFEDGPRTVDCGGTDFRIDIGPDLKLRYTNLDKQKAVKTLPKSAPPELKAELKDVAANLREIAKAQAGRLENLLVRQRRWPVDEWQRLFMHHPLLKPFGTRLVWASFDGGKLAQSFRPLEDGTLTDTDDEPVKLPKSKKHTVGMIHPLELDDADRRAWLEHLADYEVEPPFAQMDRPVVRCPEGDVDKRSDERVKGTELNALTFRSRAEKRGWRRGSVADAGSIATYYKDFPGVGVSAFLFLDGMFIGVGMDDTVTLGELRFAKADTVKIGSYEYDEPYKDDDKRVIRFGDVHALAFSETMGDLGVIAPQKDEEDADA